MANVFTKIFSSIINYFKGGRAKRDADLACQYTAEALPYLEIAAQIVVAVTPTGVDDIALRLIQTKYPKLFDGSIHTGDELKLYMLGVAADLFNMKFPKLDTTISRLAVQLAYVAARATNTLPNVAPAPSNTGIILNVKRPVKSPLAL